MCMKLDQHQLLASTDRKIPGDLRLLHSLTPTITVCPGKNPGPLSWRLVRFVPRRQPARSAVICHDPDVPSQGDDANARRLACSRASLPRCSTSSTGAD